MRVLTTWMFFDDKQIRREPPFGPRRPRGRGEEPEPGIGVAWFAGDTTTLRPFPDVDYFESLRGFETQALTESFLRNCVDLFLTDAPDFEFDRPERSMKNADIVDYIIKQPIVIERSPPFHISLKGLLTSTNLPVWIGTYMGWNVAPDHSPLLFITIPGGIIVITSATKLADALGAGLSKSVKRLFKTK
jgi:hypothetical protein